MGGGQRASSGRWVSALVGGCGIHRGWAARVFWEVGGFSAFSCWTAGGPVVALGPFMMGAPVTHRTMQAKARRVLRTSVCGGEGVCEGVGGWVCACLCSWVRVDRHRRNTAPGWVCGCGLTHTIREHDTLHAPCALLCGT